MKKHVRSAAQLKPAQRRIVDALTNGDLAELTRARYEELTAVSRSQAAYDLAELVEAGILVRVGAARATRYRLASPPGAGRRRWTPERIRAELSELCSNRTTWPSAAQFKAAGRSDLYVAASRYGGIRFWATELGFPHPERVPQSTRRRIALWRVASPGLAAVVAVSAATWTVYWLRSAGDAGTSAAAPAPTGEPRAPAQSRDRVESAGDRGVQSLATARRRPSRASLVLHAVRGRSWISARAADGRLLYAGVLPEGRRVRLRAPVLWVQVGAPANLDARVNGGRAHPLSPVTLLLVTPRRVRVVARQEPRRQLVAARSATPARETVPPRLRETPTVPRRAASSGPAPLPAPPAPGSPSPLPRP